MTTTRKTTDLGLKIHQRSPGQWYVIGHLGDRNWMPIAGPFATQADAGERRTHLIRAERDARKCLDSL